jgi:hypothetical protein
MDCTYVFTGTGVGTIVEQEKCNTIPRIKIQIRVFIAYMLKITGRMHLQPPCIKKKI